MFCLFQTTRSAFHEWAEVLTTGCYGTPSYQLALVMRELFPECVVRDLKLVIPPSDTSANYAPIQMGVSHCLNYGFVSEHVEDSDDDEDHVEVNVREDADANAGNDDRGGGPDQNAMENVNQEQGRGRPRQRVLLQKCRSKRVRSRSRSPISDDDDVFLTDHVSDIRPNAAHGPGNPNIPQLLNNPNDYLLTPNSYHKYLEAHKPSLALIQRKKLPHVSSTLEHVVKFVCEISPWDKEGRAMPISLQRHVDEATAQCVQSCLAALAHNQKSILGVVIVADGLKLVKIDRVNGDDGSHMYTVKETRLVMWNSERYLYVLFGIIKNAIVN